MPINISTPKANERSSYFIVATFRDENAALVTPNTMKWTFTNNLGQVINEREQVVIAPLATSVTIVLHGDDLVIEDFGLKREITLEGTYDSDKGNDLEYTDKVTFEMVQLVAVE